MKQRTDFFNTSITYFTLIVLFVLVRISTALNLFDFLGSVGNYLLNALIQIGFMFLLSTFMFTGLKKQKVSKTFKDFRFNKINFKSVLICVGIGLIVFILNIAVSSFFSFILQFLGYGYSTGVSSGTVSYPFWLFIVSLITTAVLPGFCEEVAHRGLLLNGFRELGMKKAILLSALLFGLMHLNIEQFFYATLIGALLGFLTISTNSIFPAMIVHFMNNAISVYLEFASVNKLFLGDFLSRIGEMVSGSNMIVAMLIILLVLISAIFLLCWLVYLLFKQTTGRKLGSLVNDLRTTILGSGNQEEKNDQKVEGQEQVLENQNAYNPVKELSIKIPTEYFGMNITQTRKPAFVEKIFLYSTLILSVGITISTFIWGVL